MMKQLIAMARYSNAMAQIIRHIISRFLYESEWILFIDMHLSFIDCRIYRQDGREYENYAYELSMRIA